MLTLYAKEKIGRLYVGKKSELGPMKKGGIYQIVLVHTSDLDAGHKCAKREVFNTLIKSLGILHM